MTDFPTAPDQLAVLAELDGVLRRQDVRYWLFGGWAVDFHVGRITRPHADIDLAVWVGDRDRVAELLAARGWVHRPEAGEDGYTGYERGAVRLELAFLARDEGGEVYTPVQDGRARWPAATFGDDVTELHGVRACVVGRGALVTEKSTDRADPATAAKDRADVASLTRPG